MSPDLTPNPAPTHGERIARLEAQLENLMAKMVEQGKQITALQSLVNTMRVAAAAERMQIAVMVAILGAVFTTILAGLGTYLVRRLTP